MSLIENSERFTRRMAQKPERPVWWQDFEWKNNRLVIRKTGIALRVDAALVHEIWNWALYLGLLHAVSVMGRLKARPRPRLWFTPDQPRPWYLVRGAAMWAGMDLAQSRHEADVTLYFDDSTIGEAPSALPDRPLNHACTDISKSHVARI
ncbi:MAG: hypothetical protein WBQ60_12625, partial [Asticcacaulis sp.]